MDAFDFQQTQQILSSKADKRGEQQQETIDGIKDKFDTNVKKPLEGLGYPLIDEGGIGVLRNVFTSTAKNVGLSEETIANISNKLNALKPSEYIKDPRGTVRKLFNDTAKKAKTEVEDKLANVSKDVKSLTTDAKGLPSKAKSFLSKKRPKIDKPLQIGEEDGESEDLVSSLGSKVLAKLGTNPTLTDLREAALKRGLQKTLTLKDDLSNAQTAASKVDILTGRIKVSKQPLRLVDDDVDEITPVKTPPKANIISDADEDVNTTVSKGAKVKKVLKDIDKGDEEEVEADPENPVGDLLAVAVGLASGLTGLFMKHKTPTFTPIHSIVPSLQIGA